MMADERILGDSEFVEKVLRHAEEDLIRRTRLKKHGYDMDKVAKRAASVFEVSVADIYGGGKSRPRAKARSLFCYWATHELGKTAAELGRVLNLDQSTISKAARRGEQLSRELGITLEPQKS